MNCIEQSSRMIGVCTKFSDPPQTKNRQLKLVETKEGQSVLGQGEGLTWRVGIGFAIATMFCLFGIRLLLTAPYAFTTEPEFGSATHPGFQILFKLGSITCVATLAILTGAGIARSLISFGWSNTKVTISKAGILQVLRTGHYAYKKDITIPLEKIRHTHVDSWYLAITAPYCDFRKIQNRFRRSKKTESFRQSSISTVVPGDRISLFVGHPRKQLEWVEHWLHQHIDQTLANLDKIEQQRFENLVTQVVAQSFD